MNRESIGALWKCTSKKGTRYSQGSIEIDGVKHKIVIFANGYKKEDNQPDALIYRQEDQ